jgi:crotonobetainyl-CoA:carnitine CoA-transferase CaiB-like acyl-CoA transferase
MTLTDGILSGLRVVELSSRSPAAVAGLLLAEAGAEVIKVEPPGGDPARSTAAFATSNRSKQSVVFDLATAAGLRRLHELIASADVLLHDLTPAAAISHGLDPDAVTHEHPRLIVASVPGFPVNHSEAERRGDDLLVQARCGLMDEMYGYRPDGGPIALRAPIASWAAAYLAASGVLTRLIVRERTGRGGAVHTSTFQGAMINLALPWNRCERPIPSLIETKHDFGTRVAAYQCADGVWLQVMNPGDRVDISRLTLVQEVLAELALPLDSWDAETFQAVLKARASDTWQRALRAGDVAVETALSLGEMLRLGYVKDNGYAVEVTDPVYGRVLEAGPPIGAAPPMRVRGPAPGLGQHTEQYVAELLEVPRPSAPQVISSEPPADRYPLAGLKVLDLGAYLAGPMAPALLSDLGATVIHVEPLSGDKMRWKPTNMEATTRGKRSIALDIKSGAGREVLTRLIEWADVVHHNIRSEAAARLGLDDAGLRRINPDVVFGHVTAYGSQGERVATPGFDTVFQALGGWEMENGGPGNGPQFSPFGSIDVACALSSAVGTLLAVYHRERTGIATMTSASLLGATALTQSETFISRDSDTIADYPRNFDNRQVGTSPGHRIYPVRDGEWVAVVATDDDQMAALRRVSDAESDDQIEAGLALQTIDDVVLALERAGVGVERVRQNYRYEFFDDPELRRLGLTVGYEHTWFGWMEQPGAYLFFDDHELQLDRAAPALGEHTTEVLELIGFGADQVDRLMASGGLLGLQPISILPWPTS